MLRFHGVGGSGEGAGVDEAHSIVGCHGDFVRLDEPLLTGDWANWLEMVRCAIKHEIPKKTFLQAQNVRQSQGERLQIYICVCRFILLVG